MQKSPFSAAARQQGSVLIVAMIFSAIIGISLVSYMQLGQTSLKISNNALYNNAAMNLAENGLEEAMHAINKRISDPSYSWSSNGWTTASPVPAGDARRRLPSSGSYTFDQGVTGTVRVYVYGYTGSAPRIVSRSTVSIPRGGTVEKWVEVQLRRTSKFANGLVAKESIQFKGNNATVDSWHSKKNNDGTLRGSPVGYSAAVKKDNGSVGSISVSADAIAVQNADIFGYAATGGAPPTVGAQGLIGPFGTPPNTIVADRVSTDFSASFDAVVAPPTTNYVLGGIGDNLNLPRVGDVPHTDGVYYYEATAISFNNRVLAIQKRVADHYQIRHSDMTSKRRPNNIAIPRQIAMYLARTLTKHSLQEIGDAFGGRDHGTVIHACKAVDNMMEQDATTRSSVDFLKAQLSR